MRDLGSSQSQFAFARVNDMLRNEMKEKHQNGGFSTISNIVAVSRTRTLNNKSIFESR